MAHLNHKGPEEKGPKTGRKLGLCKKKPEESSDFKPVQGMGMRKHSQNFRLTGKGRRMHANENGL
jgi:hypothetical protein